MNWARLSDFGDLRPGVGQVAERHERIAHAGWLPTRLELTWPIAVDNRGDMLVSHFPPVRVRRDVKPPEIWMRMGAYVHQDFLQQFPDMISGLIDFLSEEPSAQRVELQKYCDFLSRHPEMIVAAWNGTDTNLLLNAAGAKQLLEDIRTHLRSV